MPPFTLEFPLLRREFVALLRTRRAFWLLVTTVLLSSLLTLIPWPSQERAMGYYAENIGVFLTFAVTQLAVCLLVIPAFTAGAISGERERNTYEFLYTTLLSPPSIVFSKTLASVGYVLLLLAASAPLVCVLYLLGGIGFDTLLKCYAVTFAAVVSSGLVCLTISMRSRRTVHAVLRGVFWVIFYNGGLLLLIILVFTVLQQLFGHDHFVFYDDAWYLLGLTPFYSLFAQALPDWIGMGPTPGIEPWLSSVSWAGLISAGHLLYLLRKVRLPDIAMSRWRERRHIRRARRARRVRRPLLVHALMALGAHRWPLVANPVFQKEIRVEFFGRPWYRRGIFWLTLLIFIMLIVASEAERGIVTWNQFIALLFITLFVIGTAASAVTREIEQGNLDFLRGTLLPMRSILRGKVLGSMFSGFGILAAAGWALLIVLVAWALGARGYDTYRASRIPTGNPLLWTTISSILVTTLTLYFSAVLGTFASVVARRSVAALLIAYLSAIALFIGMPLVLGLLYGFGPTPEIMQYLLTPTNPFITSFELNRCAVGACVPKLFALVGRCL